MFNCLSLLLRYHLLYSDESLVSIDKVAFDGQAISIGLKASTDITAGVFLLSSSASMSSDTFKGGALSVIEAHRSQDGKKGKRLLLGPMRFINHDCNPNCEVFKLIFTLRATL